VSLGDLLSRKQLGDIVRQAREAESLTHRVQRLLPPELAPHVVGVNLRDGRLTVLADTSAWASRLRFHTLDLARSLCQVCDTEITSTRVRVHRGPAG
jgi:hypothetical protein